MDYRIESDFIGEKKVPANAYYGVQTMRAMDNFPITGQLIDPAMVHAMAVVKKAAAAANKAVGLMDAKIADAIIQAADEVIAGKLRDQFTVDPIQGGAGTSINMNTNEVLANRALEIIGREKGDYATISPNDHVNLGQSTNDAFPTAIHVAALDLLDKLLKEMTLLSAAFGKKAKEWEHVIKMGRTHLQDAVPVCLGQEFDAYRRVADRDIARIAKTQDNLYAMNMGATAVGTGLNAEPAYIKAVAKCLADYTGHPLTTTESLVDGTQNTDCYMETSSALKVCMLNMSKICNDIRMMASGPRCGLYELLLPARQPGSSIMPGKVNPVMAEVVNQVAFQVVGNDLTISMACEAGQFELNVMEPVIVHNLLQSISIMTNVFRVFREYLLEGLKANVDKMQAYVDGSVGIVTALNPHVGYKTASKLAKEAIETGKPIRELILRDKVLTEEQLAIILNPKEMTTPGIAGAELLKKK
ncbi:MAG: aspartate ammonia-lyase [Deferribacteraceae bacterium]|jgi:aspartate ammonia-lyase|nr:aspartate ammonia-lyase [Deferribacteraceae bacterium]